MPEKRRTTPSEPVSQELVAELQTATFAEIEKSVQEIQQQHDLEIAKIEEDFAIFESERRKEYERQESDFHAAVNSLEAEYASLFALLDADLKAAETKSAQALAAEEAKYLGIVRDFQAIQNEAFAKYQELSLRAAKAIDKEAEIHSVFVAGEENAFDTLRQGYTTMNDEQYELLLRAMDASKNMLDQLSRDLNQGAFNEAKFLSQAILQVIENLRDMKNKATALFKSTTSSYASKKSKIEELSLIRQKPHSVLNQSIVDEFVRQIALVERDKSAFDRLVNEELDKSKTIIGKKIIDADLRGNRRETSKFIMMYEIVIAKANFLLKRNQRLSDLLIAKYQNEIHKIKIDSFRRVEEVKLAYFMPSQFYQNSINLYSNFAFFVNESFDEIDNMLSDFIRFNQTLTQTTAQYVQTSAKVFADFRVDLIVTTNAATQKLTELITGIDRISTDIIQLESKNRLEIAEVKKQMENAEITGDYNKYLKGLEFDRFFADYQHDLNDKTIQASSEEDGELISIERKVTAANRERRLREAEAKHDRMLILLEKDIHEQALDKQFAIAEATFRRNDGLIDAEARKRTLMASLDARHRQDLNDVAYHDQSALKTRMLEEGSSSVVDFVKRTQTYINLHRRKTDEGKRFVTEGRGVHKRAYLLERDRSDVLRRLEETHLEATAKSRHAIDLYARFFDAFRVHAYRRVERFTTVFEMLLVNLSPATLEYQLKSLGISGFYRYDILSMIGDIKDSTAAVARREGHEDLAVRISDALEQAFERFTVLSEAVVHLDLSHRKAPRVKDLLERYFVETILLLRAIHQDLGDFITALHTACTTADQTLLAKAEQDRAHRLKTLNDFYDHEIWRTSRRTRSEGKELQELEREHRDFEWRMTDRVWRINRVYESSVAEADAKLAFIRKSLDADTRIVHRGSKQQAAHIEKDRLASHRLAKTRFDAVVDAYETLKQALRDDLKLQNEAIDRRIVQVDADIRSRLDSFTAAIQALPGRKREKLVALEEEKSALVVARKKILEAELSELENLKFNARPTFIAKIQSIRDRLPSDYMDLYKRMAASEEAYVRENRNTEQAFDEAFRRFVEDQKRFEEIIANDVVVMHPFDRQTEIANRLRVRAEEAFKDSMDKAETAHAEVRRHAAAADETAKRVLGA